MDDFGRAWMDLEVIGYVWMFLGGFASFRMVFVLFDWIWIFFCTDLEVFEWTWICPLLNSGSRNCLIVHFAPENLVLKICKSGLQKLNVLLILAVITN